MALRPLEAQNVNYMRNSVKAVVDAYDGSVTLYTWDDADPVLETWAGVYNNTLAPMSEISGELMSHLRYPESLFKVQRTLLATYHVTDAAAFYTSQGFWRTPADPTRSENEEQFQPPYYLTLKMPDQEEAVFSLTSTYIPIGVGTNQRNILTGFLAVNSETGNQAGKVDPGYGKLRLLQLPQSATVSGPGQVQNLFNSDPAVQTTLNLLRTGGSEVTNGNLLTLPVGGGLLYVQPVYVQSSSGTSFPSLQKVLVAFGEKVGFANTLNEALDQVFGGDSGASAGDAERPEGTGEVPATTETGGPTPAPSLTASPPGPTDQPSPTEVATPAPTVSSPSDGASPPATDLADPLDDALSRADQAMNDSQTALAEGDWAAYGQAQAELEQAIRDAVAARGQ
jgi:uncharacterized membrane protein (UPF0182 family)